MPTSPQTETPRQRSGRLAEKKVLAYAKKQGLKLLSQNYQTRYGELDLVLTDKQALVIVEVRYRARNDFGGAVATVTHAKQRRIIAATKGYMLEHSQWQEAPVRFDVVGVNAAGEIDWIEQAFLAE